jgi:hypothetical protein
MVVSLFHPDCIGAGVVEPPYFPWISLLFPCLIYFILAGIDDPDVFNMDNLRPGRAARGKQQHKKDSGYDPKEHFFYTHNVMGLFISMVLKIETMKR